MKTALICGISGQDGSYLAQFLLARGYKVVGTSRDAQSCGFSGLKALRISDRVETLTMNLTDFRSVIQILSKIKPDEIYNLSGQTSVGLSFQLPVETFESISVGVVNLLEVVRFLDFPIRVYNAGSSEVFGDTGGDAADENTAFKPRSPYATAKAAAHWAVANYREAYDMFACTGILFNHESPLRAPHFVTRKIVSGACGITKTGKGKLRLGNLNISRDWGWAPEYVEAMWRMLQLEKPEDFVIATGESNTLESLCSAVFEELGYDLSPFVEVDKALFRPSDIQYGRGNPSKARRHLGWAPKYHMRDVVRAMVAAELGENARTEAVGSS